MQRNKEHKRPDRTQNTKQRTQTAGFGFCVLDSLFCLDFCALYSGIFKQSGSVPPQKKGFTLIEILVAITLFTVIMVSAVGSLIAINDANRRTQAVRSAIDNVNFALDTMSRRLRTGMNYHCLTQSETENPSSNVPFPVSPQSKCSSSDQGGPAIAFTAAEYLGVANQPGDTGQSGALAGGTVVYRLGPVDGDGHRAIQSNTRTISGSFATSYTPMTSPDVNIEELRFVVDGAGAGDGKQPYVLITVRGSVETGKGARVQKTTFRVQTTVSQRLIDR